MTATILRPLRLSLGPLEVDLLLRREHGAGYSLIEMRAPPGFAGPSQMHWHTREHATFHILAGTLHFRLATGDIEANEGSLVHLPPRTSFAWSNQGPEQAHFLCAWTPAGFESFFQALGVAMGEEKLSVDELMQSVVPRLWARFGIETEDRT